MALAPRFDVTDKLTVLPANHSELTVTLVPVGADDSKPPAMNVTYKRVYLRSAE